MKKNLEKRKGFFFSFEAFAEIKESLEKMLSSSASSVILKVMGRSCGEKFCRRIMKEGKSKEEAFERLSKLKSEENWGELTFQDVNFERGSGRVIIKNSFEARALKKSRNSPCCHFLAGFMTGFLSQLFEGKTIAVIEEKCIAKGDEHCEFRFASSAALYFEEAIRLRNKMVKEMATKHAREREKTL